MNKIYDKYFSTGDFFDGLSKVMYDIRAFQNTQTSFNRISR